MPSKIQRVRLTTLEPHPLNSQIYGQRSLEDLISSIAEHGLLEPLVITPQRKVISGHRRLEALRALDVKLAPARIERFADDDVALVEHNRSRTRTWTERYRELQVLLPKLQGAAQERRIDGARRGAAARHGLALTKVGHRHGRCRVYEEAGRATGLGRESARKLIRVFEAVDGGLMAKELADRLDAGEISLHRAYLAVRRARSDPAKRHGRHYSAPGIDFPPFDVWTFTKRDGSYDEPGSRPDGCPPPQAWVRLVQLLTDHGDLVVDPMAGAGTILRVCERLGRECLAFDIEPRGPGVRRHDLLTGFPPAPRPPQLVILDPPYGDQRPYSRRRNDLSRCRTADEFVGKLERCVCTCLPALSPGGAIVVVAGNDSRGGGSDLAWEVGAMLRRHAGQMRRIWLPYSTSQHPGHRIARAQRQRQLLTLQREIFVVTVSSGSGIEV